MNNMAISDLINKEEVLRKYSIEREKRFRVDGHKQYVPAEKFLRANRDDPYVSFTSRALFVGHVTFAFIGGGFAGLLTCARLKTAGVERVMIIEKGGDFGGVWHWNRYPGAQCDTASMVYLPLLEETQHIPLERYAHGAEIREHCRRIARVYGLYENALLQTEVTRVLWDQTNSKWLIQTDRGDHFTAQFVGLGIGQFHTPKLPRISGLREFQGRAFHTSQWDYDYTGGSPDGLPMKSLVNKTVGLIGTGATSVQCLPHLASAARELFAFQRTPSAVDQRDNASIDPEWFINIAVSGWQQTWMRNFVECREIANEVEDFVKDGWTAITQRVREKLRGIAPYLRTPETINEIIGGCDLENMARIRRRVDDIVNDTVTAQSLKAWYGQFCKRPCFHDEYLKTFNRPNTHLIDTDGKGVERITKEGVIAGGILYPLDCIVFATGFRTNPQQPLPSNITIIGNNGEKLSSAWKNGMKSLYGIFVHNYPNLFIVQPAQGANLLSNIPHNLMETASTITAIVNHMKNMKFSEVVAESTAQNKWVEGLQNAKSRLGTADCTPGTFNNEGHAHDTAARLNVGYAKGPLAYFNYISAWRTSQKFEGLYFK